MPGVSARGHGRRRGTPSAEQVGRREKAEFSAKREKLFWEKKLSIILKAVCF